jgi:hypothetical protein
MTSWFDMLPCDASYFDSAPHVYRFPMDLPVSTEQVWKSLTSANSVADWTPLLRSIEWTSPLGEGATRTVVMPGRAATIHEYFFRWEEGRRHSFYATEANRPLFGRLAEDYLLEPTDTGCRLTWTFALEGNRATRLPFRALSPANRLFFRQMAHGATSYFARA